MLASRGLREVIQYQKRIVSVGPVPASATIHSATLTSRRLMHLAGARTLKRCARDRGIIAARRIPPLSYTPC
ncbi:hypothetical protein PsYK624_097160 [Phanerochaete sordida]|uniref:Uncharacterized protein n=1 Tax=Phanerochaete sordida TaxID=48140 RepID=A0A9P3GEX9_9APHY|nr:hypothetical protein PsYK624_097160 [Phanerochaete sordida]